MFAKIHNKCEYCSPGDHSRHVSHPQATIIPHVLVPQLEEGLLGSI